MAQTARVVARRTSRAAPRMPRAARRWSPAGDRHGGRRHRPDQAVLVGTAPQHPTGLGRAGSSRRSVQVADGLRGLARAELDALPVRTERRMPDAPAPTGSP